MKVLPQLTACPKCGLGLQAGDGPHELAWHECRKPRDADLDARTRVSAVLNCDGPVTVEAATDALLRLMIDRGMQMSASVEDIAKAVSALAELKDAGSGVNDLDELRSWIAGEGEE